MLDINTIRENPDNVREGVGSKNVSPELVDRVLALDAHWRETTKNLDECRLEQKKASGKESGTKAKDLKVRVKALEQEERELKRERAQALDELPNLPFDDVPRGKDESGNVVAREVGKRTPFNFEPKEYLALAEALGIIDVKRASAVAGSRFGYLLGDAVLLEFALVQLVFREALKEGFVPVVPPVLVKPEIMRAMGKGKFLDEHDAFYIAEDDLYLVGSAEHTLGPLHMDDVLNEQDLPKRYVGFSTAFRREAGSYGKDTKGILRVHQFDKVELFSFTAPDRSEDEHRFLVSLQERLVQALKIPYRVVHKCTGDMTWGDARQYDIESWMPGQGVYRETHSASNTTDFQARGINARYRGSDGKLHFVHTLNATGFAVGRMLVAIIENYQTKKGTIRVPRALQNYVGKKEIT